MSFITFIVGTFGLALATIFARLGKGESLEPMLSSDHFTQLISGAQQIIG